MNTGPRRAATIVLIFDPRVSFHQEFIRNSCQKPFALIWPAMADPNRWQMNCRGMAWPELLTIFTVIVAFVLQDLIIRSRTGPHKLFVKLVTAHPRHCLPWWLYDCAFLSRDEGLRLVLITFLFRTLKSCVK